MIEFRVPGECRGKMRPKASYFAGHARVYTPSKQIEYENWVRSCFSKDCAEVSPYPPETPLIAELEVYFGIPKSFSKKKRKEAVDGVLRPMKKPDADNCLKSILDSLNGLAYADDAQIVEAHVSKLYAEFPYVLVRIKEGR